MATLPDFTAVGERPTPTPSYRRPLDDSSGRILEGGIENLAEGIDAVAKKRHIEDVNMARAQASNALLDHEIEVKTKTEQIQQGVANGDIPYAQAKQKFTDAMSGLKPPEIENLDPVGQQNLQKGLQRNVSISSFALDNDIQVAQQNDYKNQLFQAKDKIGKLTGMPGADVGALNSRLDALKPLARQSGLPPEFVDKFVQDAKDENWFNQATQRSMEAKDHMGALTTLRHDLTAADGFYTGKLDTNKRNEVLRGVINDQLILENRQEHEQDKREAKAQSALNQINEQISTGVPATAQMWSNWQGVTRGTSAESQFQQALTDETKVQEVLRQPVDQQIKYVQDQTQRLDTQGGSLKDRANLMRLSTAVKQNVNLMQSEPLLFSANRNGTDVAPLNFQAASTPDGQRQIGAQIADRMATISALRKQYGSQVAVQPLLKQEAAAFASQLDNAPPAQRMGILASMRTGFQNDEAYHAAMRQIAPHSPVTAIVGQMYAPPGSGMAPTWYSGQFAPNMADGQKILTGESILNPAKGAASEEKGSFKSGFPMPEEHGAAGLQARFANGVGDLFRDRPQLADAHYSAFRDAYAALAAENGNLKGGTPDRKLVKQALAMSVGNVVDFNGGNVSMPAGMDPSMFNGVVKNAVAFSAKAYGAPADFEDRIKGYKLRELGAVGSGRYELVNGNAPLVKPNSTQPFIIDLRGQFMPPS